MGVVEPSIKGIALRSAVADLSAVLAEGVVPASEAVTRLTDAERELLQSGVHDARWYPIASYDRILKLLLDYQGRGEPDYFKLRGRAAAERLIAAGAFKQVDFVRRIDRDAAADRIALNLRMAGTLFGNMFNFGVFRLTTAGNADYGFDVEDGEYFSDMTAESIQGFVERLADEVGPNLVTVQYSRPREDLLRYRFRWLG
jgi:hypothetical protein